MGFDRMGRPTDEHGFPIRQREKGPDVWAACVKRIYEEGDDPPIRMGVDVNLRGLPTTEGTAKDDGTGAASASPSPTQAVAEVADLYTGGEIHGNVVPFPDEHLRTLPDPDAPPPEL